MKTLDEMINELVALRDKLGGNVQVFFDKNGCWDGPMSITDVEEVGHFTTSNGEFCWTSDYKPENYPVNKLVRIYSNRSCLFENLENN